MKTAYDVILAPIVTEKSMDLMNMTPIEALTKLQEIQNQIK
mgnify:CR=1 FL=1